MSRQSIYYIGRINKKGLLTKEILIKALLNPTPIIKRSMGWTFLDVQEMSYENIIYYFGRLVKYDPNALISIVDEDAKKEIQHMQPNMTLASSHFLYIPEHSGIAFQHLAGKIEYSIFMKRWADIIGASSDTMLASCEIEAISDLRTFATKLSKLSGINRIQAKVSPPNPLFGHLWKDLKEYLETRKTATLKLDEEGMINKTLKTDLTTHINGILNQTEEQPYSTDSLPISDAAILMAVDGYGSGFVKGWQNKELVVIKTSETIRNFQYSSDPDSEELFKKTHRILEKIKAERRMKHDK